MDHPCYTSHCMQLMHVFRLFQLEIHFSNYSTVQCMFLNYIQNNFNFFPEISLHWRPRHDLVQKRTMFCFTICSQYRSQLSFTQGFNVAQIKYSFSLLEDHDLRNCSLGFKLSVQLNRHTLVP